ncbi:23S rRNA (pseudouridine(1915)-N(3))-methyltransferase RlmH [Clostridiaceae bacterium HFYG-1003]|nr:23S rRNA (pseudouridine(1915)-N(3))-methyltransferase RlmH [Clostridiaceae bacterium HFYG-1003]
MIKIYLYETNSKKSELTRSAQAEYMKRLSRIAAVRFRKPEAAPPEAIYFHPAGKSIDSPGLAELFARQLQSASELHLVLGAPPAGSPPDVQLVSLPLSPDIESILILEQIYRAFKISSGEPYHK